MKNKVKFCNHSLKDAQQSRLERWKRFLLDKLPVDAEVTGAKDQSSKSLLPAVPWF